MIPRIINGGKLTDLRGKIFFNNNFDASNIKRIYIIQNNLGIKRGWQGHKIEQRWFLAIEGFFTIQLIKIDNWKNPKKNLNRLTYKIKSDNLDCLHVPPGYASCIISNNYSHKLLVCSDYNLNEIEDDYKFEFEYFNT